MDTKFIIIAAIALAAAAGGGYYAGAYAGEDAPRGGEIRQFGNRQGGGAGGPQGMGMRNQGGFTAGEIIAKDESGITIQMSDGGTRLVLIGKSTQIMTSAAGSADDLVIGSTVSVTGSTTAEGLIAAQSVQVRSAGMEAPQR